MSREGRFLIYCIEAYKQAKGSTGRQVYALFRRFDVIGYVTEFYESLHTTGDAYIVADIDRYITKQRSASAAA